MKTVNWCVGKRLYKCQAEEGACPFCLTPDAVVELPPPLRARQTDGTTHVCLPALGGCNQGFAKDGAHG